MVYCQVELDFVGGPYIIQWDCIIPLFAEGYSRRAIDMNRLVEYTTRQKNIQEEAV